VRVAFLVAAARHGECQTRIDGREVWMRDPFSLLTLTAAKTHAPHLNWRCDGAQCTYLTLTNVHLTPTLSLLDGFAATLELYDSSQYVLYQRKITILQHDQDNSTSFRALIKRNVKLLACSA
jgi:hypothetical protein